MTTRQASARRTASSDAAPDSVIGDFVRSKEIGKGSFATVYLAKHRKRGSHAAVKCVDQKKLTRKLKDNLESEIRILKSLQHPHIVALFSCSDTPTHIYLVMEYCQLSDLAQFMKKREQLVTLPETADIFQKYPNSQFGLNEVVVRHFVKQIASALEYLRNRNLIHRDIKPQNLLLNPSPAYMARQKPEDMPLAASEHSLVPAVGVQTLPMLKIADFGFARHLPQAMMAETLCGSPLYMAPEILSYQKYDAKADLWSVGAVAYEMMVGKPPFRAANHIELLKKIEDAKDRIPFPTALNITSDLHGMIRHLLKRQPTERVSFEGFFKSPPVVDPIPGLVGEDIPRTASVPIPDPAISELSRRMQKQLLDPLSASPPPESRISMQGQSRPSAIAVSPLSQATSADHRPELTTRRTSVGMSRPVDIQRPRQQERPDRPPMIAHATAPARDLLLGAQYSARDPTGIRRTSDQNIPLPSTSAPREHAIGDSPRVKQQRHPDDDQNVEEKTAQDLAFEKEYVLVEKKAVEVNAFADAMAAHPHPYGRTAAAMTRRSTSQGLPNSTTGAQPPSPSTALQLATGRKYDAPQRQPSFDRRYVPNPSSATNMLSKALNMANARLFGVTGSPPLGAGVSPPRGYNAFASYGNPSPGLAITEGAGEGRAGQDEDAKLLKLVEAAATRSDTVYSFAEVKYRQLLPATPSAEEGATIRQIGALEKTGPEDEEQELTQVAVVAVSEEALVLFVKALAILAKSIDLASTWWVSYRRSPSPSDSPLSPASRASADVSRRMNNVVQWMRNRFNECLEKSEIVGRRLVEAQKHLPEDHPGHPSNHPAAAASEATASTTKSRTGSGASSAASIGAGAENIQLTSGVTAEKLMFERAVEMSRAAAVNELVGEDLRGCEISYRTAIILLEAVLEGDDEPLLVVAKNKEAVRAGADDGRSSSAPVAGLDGEERATVVKLLESTKHRLRSLLRKIQHQANAEKEHRRRQSSTGGTGTSVGSATRTRTSVASGTSPGIGGSPA